MRPHLSWAIIIAAFALMPVHARAVQQPWDQQKVTHIVSDLAQAVSGILDEFNKQPPATIASMQTNARYRLGDDLRLLESETHVLHSMLELGKDRDATLPIYERIGSLAQDARDNARKQSATEAVQKRVERAEALWSQLTPYYETNR